MSHFKIVQNQPFASIPHIIHQTWKTKELTGNFLTWRNHCKSLHPNWEFKLWNDEENRDFIRQHYPWFLSTYDGYDKKIKRIDAVRYFYLYHYGGIYMDMDFTCLKSLDEIVSFDKPVFGSELRKDISIANAFMASPPQHPLFAYIISQLSKYEGLPVLEATGPKFLSGMIREYGIEKVKIFEVPFIYTHEWNETAPCKEDQLEECANLFPDSFTTTFWTHTWWDHKD